MPTKKDEGSNGEKEKKDEKQAGGNSEELEKANKKLDDANKILKKELKQAKDALKEYELSDAEEMGVELAEGEDIYRSPNGKKYIRVTQSDGSKTLFTLGEDGKRIPV